MPMPRVTTTRIAVETPCPSCGVLEVIAVDLSSVLTTPADDTPTLKVRAKSKPLEHWCNPAYDQAPNLFATEPEHQDD